MLLNRINVPPRLTSTVPKVAVRHLSTSQRLNVNQVKQLPNWDLELFQRDAFNARIPAKLPRTVTNLPPACKKWFIHDGNASQFIDIDNPPHSSKLRASFWAEHESTMVPLEVTSKTPSNSSLTTETTFTRTHAPLKLLLTYLATPKSSSDHTISSFSEASEHSIYLAQCPLPSLPPALYNDLPTPPLVLTAGKGDIYASSLWMGLPPTYTPLHRDPNPNLFLQLAGRKIVRLLPPEVGDAVFDLVQEKVGGGASRAVRGEEMMVGREREVLHEIVWGGSGGLDKDGLVGRFACEASLGVGEALFIPKGWWHSVVGVGEGVTASANWWFR